MRVTPDRISLYPINIDLKRNGIKFGSGTGFFYRSQEGCTYLITNYHVATARNPKDPAIILNSWPDSPDELEWSYFDRASNGFVRGNIDFLKYNCVNWLEHKDRDKGVDIVALKVESGNGAVPMTQADLELVECGLLEVAADLFVVGYPFGYAAGDYLPIWKKGTIASEPYFKPEGMKRFYIDAFVHPGMSGSPVFKAIDIQVLQVNSASRTAIERFNKSEISAIDAISNMSGALKTVIKRSYSFVGIYSGRLPWPMQVQDPQLGIVWRSELIDEILYDGVVAAHPYPPSKVE